MISYFFRFLQVTTEKQTGSSLTMTRTTSTEEISNTIMNFAQKSRISEIHFFKTLDFIIFHSISLYVVLIL